MKTAHKKRRLIAQLLTTTKAARLLNISASTMLRAVQDGKIKATLTPGGHFRIHPDHLRAWLSGPKDRVEVLEAAIRWALGENGKFRERQPGEGAYWWRRELQRRSGLP